MLLVWVTVNKCPLISDLWASDTTCALADLISVMCDLHWATRLVYSPLRHIEQEQSSHVFPHFPFFLFLGRVSFIGPTCAALLLTAAGHCILTAALTAVVFHGLDRWSSLNTNDILRPPGLA